MNIDSSLNLILWNGQEISEKKSSDKYDFLLRNNKYAPFTMQATALQFGLKIHIIRGDTPIILICKASPRKIQSFMHWLDDGGAPFQYLPLILSKRQFLEVKVH